MPRKRSDGSPTKEKNMVTEKTVLALRVFGLAFGVVVVIAVAAPIMQLAAQIAA
jgi:hypothetical protein